MNAIKCEWKWIEGYEDRYMVSSEGEVRSHVYKSKSKTKIIGRDVGGYLGVTLIDSQGVPKGELVHRVVAKAFIPNPLGLLIVGHVGDLDKKDNRVSKLYWTTGSENTLASFTNGRSTPTKGKAVSTDEEVQLMYLAVKGGETQTSVSARFNVSRTGLSRIMSGKRRSSVTSKL